MPGPGYLRVPRRAPRWPMQPMMTGAHYQQQFRQQQPVPATASLHTSNLPRPKRLNPVSTLRRGLVSLPKSKPVNFVYTRSGLKYVPKLRNTLAPKAKYLGSTLRQFSSQRQQRAARAGQAKFMRWWAVPAVIVLVSALFVGKKRKKDTREGEEGDRPARVAKPWQVAAYSTLPLKAMSRLWGKFNDITLPVWMREPGFKLYSYVFGVNLDEVAEQDLRNYANLGEFFYRELKPGVRPIDERAALVSPADGKVLHFGVIHDGQVEQVKGVTYSLDALLGQNRNASAPAHKVDFEYHDEDEVMDRHRDFAIVNGIPYTVDSLIGGTDGHANNENGNGESQRHADAVDHEDRGDVAIRRTSSAAFNKVSKELLKPDTTPESEKELFFAVVYLAPGDYHRFHSPTHWVSQVRRHFSGELYSVSPYFQSRLANLFCLNERVALLGRWRYGFFSMTPVGATNVGSIRIHFDKDLRTNTTRRYAEQHNGDEWDGKSRCYEATYAGASKLLGGYPLAKGEQMGGFNLGSTVVLVFEAPKSFKFVVQAGDNVKVGQAMGVLDD